MRRIGTLSDKEAAETFRDYLLTQQIQSQVEPTGEEWAIWVYDEDRIDATKEQLEQFVADPQAERYQQAIVEADRIRHDKVREALAAKKKQIDLTRRWNRPLIAQIPVTFTLVVLSVIVTLGTKLGENLDAFGGQLTIVPKMTREGDYIQYPTNYRELPGITEGQVWRLATPAFLHFGLMHLLFNMYWLVMFGGMIERVRGRRTMIGLFLLTAVVGNLTQLYWKGPHFGGMSGVDAGLFGYLWITGQMEPESGLALPQHLVFIMIGYLLLAATGILGPLIGSVANAAHFGGLFAGMATAAASVWWRRLR